MKTSRLTDKHFNSRNVQRFHKYLNRDRSWGTFLLSLLVLPTFLAASSSTLGGIGPDFLEWCLICLSPCLGYCVNYIFVMCVGFTVQAVSHIFYKPPKREEVILINPDGNPEMCKMTDYPAIDFYGYRLPNAGDIGKIEKFMNFDKKKFLAYTSKALL